jgi:PIN domain nuclease of toxin-antitoxin system
VKTDRAPLLDTYVWVWLAYGEAGRLSTSAMRAIEEAGSRKTVWISVISVWEIALLESKRRLGLPVSVQEWVKQALDRPDLELLGLDPAIAVESCNLPGTFHADPADRFLVATARLKSATLVTRDKRIVEYGRQGHVKAMAA